MILTVVNSTPNFRYVRELPVEEVSKNLGRVAYQVKVFMSEVHKLKK